MPSLVAPVLTGRDKPVSNRPSNAEAVARRRPSSQLVHDDQRLPGRELSSGEPGSQGNASYDFSARVCEQGKREPGTRTRRRSTPPGWRKSHVDLVHHGLAFYDGGSWPLRLRPSTTMSTSPLPPSVNAPVGLSENRCGLEHLCHERRNAPQLVVAGPHPKNESQEATVFGRAIQQLLDLSFQTSFLFALPKINYFVVWPNSKTP